MQAFEITAEPRSDVGKGASRRLRRDGKVPGIIYGTHKDAVSITINHDELIHQIENEAFFSHVLAVKVGGEEIKVVLKDLQRHPFKPSVMHVDFQRIDENEALTMRVPLHFINEATCIGVKQEGGAISHIMTELEITCLPKDLPEYIEIDMANLKLGDSVHLRDVILPEGVQILSLVQGGDAEQSVASVHVQHVIEEEEDLVAEEGVEVTAAAAAPEGEPAEKTDDD